MCGPNVIDMSYAYSGCNNLTGSPVCGNNVTNMRGTYGYCTNLIGSPACGPNVTDMYRTYINCPNIYGNAYLYNVTNAAYCFSGRNISNMLNIYTYKPETFINSSSNITGTSLIWTQDVINNCWYNTIENIYVYQLT